MRFLAPFTIAALLLSLRAFGGGACNTDDGCQGPNPTPAPANSAPMQNTTAPNGVAPAKPPTSANAGSSAAATAASQAKTMTGARFDSQNDVQKNVKKLTDYGSSSSRSSGTLDIAEGTLILMMPPPINYLLAGRYLDSGRKAHQAADNMGTLAVAAEQNDGKMGAMTDAAGGNAPGAQGGAGGGSGASSPAASAGSSGAFGSDRANDLFNKLEAAGLDRNDFVNAVNRSHGDPAALGAYLEDKTNAKVGADDVLKALDTYLASNDKGTAAEGLNAYARSEPSAMPSHPVPTAAADPAKKTEKLDIAAKNALRDKLRASLAKGERNPAAVAFDSETLQPLRDDKLFQGVAEADGELSLFDVIHARYTRLTDRMRPGLRGVTR